MNDLLFLFSYTILWLTQRWRLPLFILGSTKCLLWHFTERSKCSACCNTSSIVDRCASVHCKRSYCRWMALPFKKSIFCSATKSSSIKRDAWRLCLWTLFIRFVVYCAKKKLFFFTLCFNKVWKFKVMILQIMLLTFYGQLLSWESTLLERFLTLL